MIYLVAGVEIDSEKSLEEVASLISGHLLGGIPFVGKDQYIYDEIPAVYASHDILGLRVILQGDGGADGYFLEIYPNRFPDTDEASSDVSSGEMTDYIIFLLSGIEGIRVQKPGSPNDRIDFNIDKQAE